MPHHGSMDTTESKIEKLRGLQTAQEKLQGEIDQLAREILASRVDGVVNSVSGILHVNRETVRRRYGTQFPGRSKPRAPRTEAAK